MPSNLTDIIVTKLTVLPTSKWSCAKKQIRSMAQRMLELMAVQLLEVKMPPLSESSHPTISSKNARREILHRHELDETKHGVLHQRYI